MRMFYHALPSRIYAALAVLLMTSLTASAAIQATLVVEPVRDTDAKSHPLTVVFKAENAIDLQSLGNDDLLVDSGSLFRPGEQLNPTLQTAEATVPDGTEVSATYQLSPPAGGWTSFDSPSVDVRLEKGAVSDETGNASQRTRLGSLEIAIGNAPAPTPTAKPITLHSDPITDPDQAVHQFTIRFQETDPAIDPDTLGDDDVTFGDRRSLFNPAAGPELNTRLVSMASGDQGALSVIYQVERPATGWDLWSDDGANVYLTREAVFDKTGTPLKGQTLGLVIIDLGGPPVPQPPEDPVLSLSVLSDPITDKEAAQHRFQVRFEIPDTITIDLASLGDDDITVGITRSIFNPDPAPWISAKLISQRTDNVGALEVTYELDRPEDGWDVWERTHLLVLLEQDSVFTTDGMPILAQTIGSITVNLDAAPTPTPVEPPNVDVELVSGPVSHPDQAVHEFQIRIQSDNAIDINSLDDDDVTFGELGSLFNPVPGPQLKARFISHATDEAGILQITYQVDRPETGWDSWKRQDVPVFLKKDAIVDVEGIAVPSGKIGTVPLDLEVKPAPQQIDFEEWARELAEILEVDDLDEADPDIDGDQLDNVAEFALGRNPLAADHDSPLKTQLTRVGDLTYLELEFSVRTNAFGIRAELEGSTDGLEWALVDDQFEILSRTPVGNPNIESVTARSREPLHRRPHQLYRIRVTAFDNDN